MPNIHPSLIIKMSIDSREYSDELALEVKRNYNHVATIFVEPQTNKVEEIENTYRYDVVLHKDYWDANADALWERDMPEWLHNAIYKVSNNIVAQNETAKEHNQKLLEFAWAEINFAGNALFAFKTQPNSSLSEAAVDLIISARKFMNEGTLGTDIACIRIPSRKNYEKQLAAAKKSAEDSTENSDGASGEDSVEASGENPVENSSENSVEISKSFAHATQIWGIEYSDGVCKEFDSSTGRFI